MESAFSALTPAETLVTKRATGRHRFLSLLAAPRFNQGFFMKTKLILLSTVAALSVVAAQQSQAHHHGWYIGLEGGANWAGDNDIAFDFGNPPAPPPTFLTSDFDTGWAALGTVGYAFDNNWRIELEGGYRDNDIDIFAGGPVPVITGDLSQITAMVNFLYDIPLTEKIDLTLGLGAGANFSQFETSLAPATAVIDDEDVSFAFQAIAGLSYELTSRLDLTLTYRYLHSDSPDYSQSFGAPFNTYEFEDLENHTVTVGLRFDLHEDEAPLPPAPPPAPPPAAAPEPQQFIIYFGFNKCNITPEADKVLGEAAAVAKSDGAASVQIVGHTDTVGSDAYNRRLSECRANAAKTNLVDKGVSAGSITTSGRGEGELLVKTGNNVKEPQNRRATIDVNK
jgi:outer membrane protein OmpA-like peptidoglycan-associated protein